MHPEVVKFSETFAEKMKKEGRNVRLNENELRFLDQVYGPEFAFNFQGLVAQMLFFDYKGKSRFLDFLYEVPPVRLILEADSLRSHVNGITHKQYDDHLERQNDLILNGGWILVRFSANMIMHNPMHCRRQLVQAVGKSLILAENQQIVTLEQLTRKRTQIILQLAGSHKILKPQQVADRFGISRKTAVKWLRNLVTSNELLPVKSTNLVIGYTLPGMNLTMASERVRSRVAASGSGSA